MSTIRSLLVHMDGTPRSTARLELARGLAQQHRAHLTALFAAELEPADAPYMHVGGAVPVDEMREVRAAWRRKAKAWFDTATRGDADATWADLGTGAVAAGFAQQALYADLVVLGQHDGSDPQSGELPADFVESVILASGKPALVVPYAGEFRSIGQRVLIAWKPRAESARAVAAALPLLRDAAEVHVVTWAEAPGAEPAAPALGIERFLQLHGVKPVLHRYTEAPREVGELLLSRAADVGADLLVMGCYGHSRLREYMLGGVTRTVLQAMTVPVLMSH
jgi:nucleotide-binding universal stress UspA family protein